MPECSVLVWVTLNLTSGTFPILLAVGIPNYTLYVVQPFSHIEEKIELYQINIYIFSSTQRMEKQTLYLPKVASPYLVTVPVFELPCNTSNMYFVNVNLMNSVEYTKIQRCIKDHLDLL